MSRLKYKSEPYFYSLFALHAGYVDSDEPVEPPYKLRTSKYCMLTYRLLNQLIQNKNFYAYHQSAKQFALRSFLQVIKLEFIHRLKIKRNDWLLVDTCLQAANHCALF